MDTTPARLLRALLGLVICLAGVGAAVIAIVLTLENAWGWIFLVGPLALILSSLFLRWGTHLISR